ncbi:competence protein CoiA [Rhizobium mongolense]|uniref:Competence protein CoiA-like N-terminal domain-containing protein n=1 Tax=Rhizobium mongolense TaxID=57676 RepID=A0A7W6RKS5_9HYPH|nr:hypothetical protein [Rhizobium mongolense]
MLSSGGRMVTLLSVVTAIPTTDQRAQRQLPEKLRSGSKPPADFSTRSLSRRHSTSRLAVWRRVMKFGIIDGRRRLAERGLRGACPVCGAPILAKCGSMRLHHWAHVSTISCDPWWEPETQWHRDWKDRFPTDWQEHRRIAPDGEIHIADVLTAAGVAIEFQHSSLSSTERASREEFHQKLAWIVDGMRLKRDHPSFFRPLVSAPVTLRKYQAFVLPLIGVPIIERWSKARSPVYLDFRDEPCGVPGIPDGFAIWRLRFGERTVVATPVSRESFVAHHCDGSPMVGFPVLPGRRVVLTEFESHLFRKRNRRPRF